MLDYLDESGLAKNTIVIYSSDQGFYLGEHGWYDKRWMFEESLRDALHRPLAGRRQARHPHRQALIQNIDYAPTFLEMAGAQIPADMQGRSLVPVLKGETPGGLAQGDLLPLLRREHPQRRRPRRRPHRPLQADLLPQDQASGTSSTWRRTRRR